MNKIRIIDLLNKIANEEAPRKIKYGGATYLYNLLCEDYEDTVSGDLLFEDRFDANKILTDELEILDKEDEFEDIEPLVLKNFSRTGEAVTIDRFEDYSFHNFKLIEDALAKVILNQKKIIERLKELEK